MNEPRLTRIKSGWAAHGDGWAVHGPTKQGAIEKFKKREEFYEDLAKRPPWYENSENPHRIIQDE